MEDTISELEEVIDIVKTSSIEEISEIYESLNPNVSDEEKVQDSDVKIQTSILEHNKLLSLSTKNFSTREELMGSVHDIAVSQGYSTTIKKSKRDRYVIIGCDRGGRYRGTNISIEQRKRTTGSRLTNCPFQIWGKRRVDDGFWKIEIKNISHNHEPSADMSGHPSCRRFSKEEIIRIKEMTMAGIPPRQILSSLRQTNPNLQAISRTLYNAKAKIVRESLGGRLMIQALFEELGQGDFSFDIRRDEDAHLTHLFFAHPYSVALTNGYSNVFVMDCTYKTNKYKMPLLDIIGVSSFNSSFYSCFTFMQKEEEGDYVWALERFAKILGDDKHPLVIVTDRELALMKAIQVVFPRAAHLLCVWHIEKNILTNCKPHFEENEDWETFLLAWTSLINSPDESTFEEAWHLFEIQYKEKASILSYIRGTWLPFKEKFVTAWTEKHAHFGNRVTSRAEGAHSTLKKYLQVSTCDFREVKGKISLAIENQFQEIKTKLSSEKVRVPHKFCIPYFKEVVTHVSTFALGELYKQYELAITDKPLASCKDHFSKTMGLPCAHKIRGKKDGSLQLVHVHPQWRIDTRSFTSMDVGLDNQQDQIDTLLKEFHDKYQQMPLVHKEDCRRQIAQLVDSSLPMILEPSIQAHKGRPSGSKKRKGICSTKRDLSAFEIVEKTRKCGVCKGVGHNSRTCQNKTETSSFVFSDEYENPYMMEMIDLNMLPCSTNSFQEIRKF